MKTNRILKLMKFLFWVIFIGLILRTSIELFNLFFSPFGNLENTKEVYLNLDLSEYSQLRTTIYYVSIKALVIAVLALKTYLAYLAIKIFVKINFKKPFNTTTAKLLTKISHVALVTGILALISNGYNMWINKIDFISILTDPIEKSSGEFLFLAGILFIIAQIFKIGTNIQSENELTI